MSRIGKLPVKIPASVEVNIGDDNTVTVAGPKGSLTQQFAPSMSLTRDNGTVVVQADNEREHRSLHGLTRTLAQQHGRRRDRRIQA